MRLNVSDNRLTSLPQLPEGLVELDVSGNHLTSLPKLPVGLTRLDIRNNQLGYLPPLPGALTSLNASNNSLASLPSIPLGLEFLNLDSNRLTSVPSRMLYLSSGSAVRLYGNSLSPEVLDLLNQVCSGQMYQGPTIYFDGSVAFEKMMKEYNDKNLAFATHRGNYDWAMKLVERGTSIHSINIKAQKQIALMIGSAYIDQLTAPTFFLQERAGQELNFEETKQLTLLKEQAQALIAKVPSLSEDTFSTIFAGMTLASIASLDSLKDHGYLNDGTNIDKLVTADLQQSLRQATFRKLQKWDAPGLDGAGQAGGFSILKSPWSRLPKLTDELLARVERF